MKNNVIVTILVVIIVGAIGFFAGMKYNQGKQSANSQQFGGGQGTRAGSQLGRGSRMGGRQTIGEIISQAYILS